MIFNPTLGQFDFKKISVDKFIEDYKKINPQSDIKELKNDLLYFKDLKSKGEKCNCGNPIWIVGSAISGKGCFTCITGETNSSKDYEIQ